MKRILISLLLAIGCAQSALAMDDGNFPGLRDNAIASKWREEVMGWRKLRQCMLWAAMPAPEVFAIYDGNFLHEQELLECPMCLDDVDEEVIVHANHSLCTSCANQNIQYQLKVGSIENLRCTFKDCNYRLTATDIRKIINNPIRSQDIFFMHLITAAANGNVEKLTWLLSADINVNAQNHDGDTALICAAFNGEKHACEILITAQADVNLINNTGSTALRMAAQNGHDSICKSLITAGARVEPLRADDNTALMGAADNDHESVCRAIISHAHFLPVETVKEFQVAQKIIIAILCAFNRVCPGLPRDIKHKIFVNDFTLWDDACSSGLIMRIQLVENAQMKLPDLPNEQVPIRMIRGLITGGVINANEFIPKIKEYYYEQLSPLMLQALRRARNPVISALLNPENLEENFGKEIEQNIRRRLGLLEVDDADASNEKEIGEENEQL